MIKLAYLSKNLDFRILNLCSCEVFKMSFLSDSSSIEVNVESSSSSGSVSLNAKALGFDVIEESRLRVLAKSLFCLFCLKTRYEIKPNSAA